MVRKYSQIEVKDVMGIQRAYLGHDYLNVAPQGEADSLLTKMGKYPDIWPPDLITRLREIGGEIARTGASILSADSAAGATPPSFHHAFAGEMEEHEVTTRAASEYSDRLKEQLKILQQARRRLFGDIGL